MFAIVQNGQIIMFITAGNAWEYQGIQYPPQWIAQSTQEQRDQLGIVDVIYGPQANQTYYWVSAQEPVYDAQTNTVNINYTSTPKDLDQLKVQQTQQINNTAYTILQPTDWMVVKAFETSTPISPDWNTWRASIRSTANVARVAVNACTSVDEMAALPAIEWPLSPDQKVAEK